MTNAKAEFLRLLKQAGDYKELICATINVGYSYTSEDKKPYILKRFHTSKQYEAFLHNLDQTYDEGYGGQELHGTVWFANGKWAERGEYDGSERWELHEYPEFPIELL